jgi:hypothetical protein
MLLAVADAAIKERLLKGTPMGEKTFKVHLDRYNQLPYLTGQQNQSRLPPKNWKAVLLEMKYDGLSNLQGNSGRRSTQGPFVR